ncbi:hypothetical protein ACQ27_gp427 [Klebsiella phage K64-1]|nr:hypothetical protein ACQ27_gp427 [Klebsiella phage K64-1]
MHIPGSLNIISTLLSINAYNGLQSI